MFVESYAQMSLERGLYLCGTIRGFVVTSEALLLSQMALPFIFIPTDIKRLIFISLSSYPICNCSQRSVIKSTHSSG